MTDADLTEGVPNPSATHLLHEHHSGDPPPDTERGRCCFCADSAPGCSTEESTSEKYFSDDDLLSAPGSDHVCYRCAYCMDQRSLKQGHWLAHEEGVEQPSTGDLLHVFRRLRDRTYRPPLAVHVTSSPIRSSHAYLWTPVNLTERPLTVAFDRENVRIEDWSRFGRLVGSIEDLRLHGFTFDEIRSGEPRVASLKSIGRSRYSDREAVIEPVRRSARLELALTLSRSDDDQPRTELTDSHDPLTTDDDSN